MNWSQPRNTGAEPITGYTVYLYRGSTLVMSHDAAADDSSWAATGLTNGLTYRFRVAARNDVVAPPNRQL